MDIFSNNLYRSPLLFGAKNAMAGALSVEELLVKGLRKYKEKEVEIRSVREQNQLIDNGDISESGDRDHNHVINIKNIKKKDVVVSEERQWDVLGIWFEMWNAKGARMCALETMAKPIIESMCSDKRQYQKLHQQLLNSEKDKYDKLCQEITNVNQQQTLVGTDPRPDSKDILELYTRTQAVEKEMHALVRQMSDKSLINGLFCTDRIKPLEQSIQATVLQTFKDLKCQMPPPTSNTKQNMDYAHQTSLVQASLTVRDLDNMCWAINKLCDSQRWFKIAVKIVHISNEFARDANTESGYRCLKVYLTFPDVDANFISLLEIHHSKFDEIEKNGYGHYSYQSATFLIDFVFAMVRQELPKDKKSPVELTTLEKLVRKLFDL